MQSHSLTRISQSRDAKKLQNQLHALGVNSNSSLIGGEIYVNIVQCRKMSLKIQNIISEIGQFSAPMNLSLPSGLPISVQPNLAEVESTAWLVVLLGSLAFMFLLLSAVMFYYRRRKTAGCGTSAGYLPAAVNDLEYHAKTPGKKA